MASLVISICMSSFGSTKKKESYSEPLHYYSSPTAPKIPSRKHHRPFFPSISQQHTSPLTKHQHKAMTPFPATSISQTLHNPHTLPTYSTSAQKTNPIFLSIPVNFTLPLERKNTRKKNSMNRILTETRARTRISGLGVWEGKRIWIWGMESSRPFILTEVFQIP